MRTILDPNLIPHACIGNYLMKQGIENPLHPIESDIKNWKELGEEEIFEQVRILEDRILTQEPKPLVGVEDKVNDILLSALRKDPDERPSAKKIYDMLWEATYGTPKDLLKVIVPCACSVIGMSFIAGGGLIYLLMR